MSSKRPRPAPASDNDLQKLVSTGWEKDDKRIRKSFKFKGFRRAWAFMTEVALKADELDHHPEWTNVYSTVKVELTTHSEDRLTELDTTLAASMDEAYQKWTQAPKAPKILNPYGTDSEKT